jgi:hypothetical protein
MAMLFSGLLHAEIIFDLSAQHFSNSLDGQGEGARYDLPKAYVSTALKYQDGHYLLTTFSASQKMEIEIKNPLSDWSVSFDMSYYLYYETHPIRFTSDTGKTIIVSFEDGEIFLNGSQIYNGNISQREEIVGTLSKNGNSVTLSVNGYVTKTINISNFSKLKFVSVSLVPDSHGDVMNGLTIGTSD